MWLFDCGLDIIEWRRTIVVYLSAIAPIILSLYLVYKNQMKKWIALTLLSSFLIADIGYVLVSGQTAIAGKGDELLNNPDVGRLFLGG